MVNFGISGIASVTVIAYLVGEIVKATRIENKWIPVICGVVGAILGAASVFCVGSDPNLGIIDAIAVGIVSGLAATGADQIGKQLTE